MGATLLNTAIHGAVQINTDGNELTILPLKGDKGTLSTF
jgi:hypothetical protein